MRLTWPLLSLVLGACTGTTGDDQPSIESKSAALQTSECWSSTLSWGSGDASVGLTPRGHEQVARGPQAVAVGNDGEVFVLDSVNGRVLGVTAASQRVAVANVPTDAEALAMGPNGAFAVHSSFQAKTWIFDADGAPAGEVDVPRSFRSLVGISLSSSRNVVLHSAYQETYSIGSPAAPKDLPTVLSQKREGAFQLESGPSVAVQVKDGEAQLLLLRNSAGDDARTQVSRSHAIPGSVTGANLVGISGDIACLRLERVEQPGDTIEVHRRAVCINALTGATVVDSSMAAPDIYVPRHELAVGGNAPVLASLKPSTNGLTVESCEVAR